MRSARRDCFCSFDNVDDTYGCCRQDLETLAEENVRKQSNKGTSNREDEHICMEPSLEYKLPFVFQPVRQSVSPSVRQSVSQSVNQ